MMNVCYNCGLYRANKVIDPDGPYAVCPECGYRHPFLQLPLLIVCGASGVGKSAMGHHLLGRTREVVVMEADILWRPRFDWPQEQYRDFHETWLRICKNISQADKPVLLINAGGIPRNLEPCVERRYFSTVHYLALVCDDDELAARLRQRPAWRGSSEVAGIEKQVKFNQWFKDRGRKETPAVTLLDTTGVSVEQTAEQVAEWVREKLSGFCSSDASA